MTDDFIDSFFSFAHPRFGVFDDAVVWQRLANPDAYGGPLSHQIIATMIAFGARFSDHPVLVADREECIARDKAAGGGVNAVVPRSRIGQLLVIRSREVVEENKSHRVICLDNAKVLFLLETTLARE